MKTDDRIMRDVVEAHREGFFGLPPSKLGQMSTEECVVELRYRTREDARKWLREHSNMRGPRFR